MDKITLSIISGSTSDKHIVDNITEVLNKFEIKYETKIISAHRNPLELRKYVKNSKSDIFIAVAGMAAHLPGVIASFTIKPVIGVPVSSKLSGIDALLSIVQMPTGVPVATVAIDGGKNAALLAVQILSLNNANLKEKLISYRKDLAGV